MPNIQLKKFRKTFWGLALGVAAASAASAQSRVVLPAGSVIIVRTTTPLQSATAKVGQTFDTNVEESIGVDEFTVIPAGRFSSCSKPAFFCRLISRTPGMAAIPASAETGKDLPSAPIAAASPCQAMATR